MTDFLQRVSRMAMGLVPVAQPVIVSRYAPGAITSAPEMSAPEMSAPEMSAPETPLAEEQSSENIERTRRTETETLSAFNPAETESLSSSNPTSADLSITHYPSSHTAANSERSEGVELFSSKVNARANAEEVNARANAEAALPPSVEFQEDATPLDVTAPRMPHDTLDAEDSSRDSTARAGLLREAHDHVAPESVDLAGSIRESPTPETPSRVAATPPATSGAELRRSPPVAIYEERHPAGDDKARDAETTRTGADVKSASPVRTKAASLQPASYEMRRNATPGEKGDGFAADESRPHGQESEPSLQPSQPSQPLQSSHSEPAEREYVDADGPARRLSAERDRATHDTNEPSPMDKSGADVRSQSNLMPAAERLRHRQGENAERAASGQVIRVSIGRIEVRAVMPHQPPVESAAPPAPKVSLDEYLRQHRGRRQ